MASRDFDLRRSAIANEADRQKARKGIPFEKETTHGAERARNGSLYWRPLGPLLEITVYPLLFGQVILVTGRRDKDAWQRGYYYPDLQSGWRAAEAWDGEGDPGFGFVKKVTMNEKRMIEEEI